MNASHVAELCYFLPIFKRFKQINNSSAKCILSIPKEKNVKAGCIGENQRVGTVHSGLLYILKHLEVTAGGAENANYPI